MDSKFIFAPSAHSKKGVSLNLTQLKLAILQYLAYFLWAIPIHDIHDVMFYTETSEIARAFTTSFIV